MLILLKKNKPRKLLFVRQPFADAVSLLIPRPVETVPAAIGSQSKVLTGSPTVFSKQYAEQSKVSVKMQQTPDTQAKIYIKR